MSIAAVIKEVGRGAAGARSLGSDLAHNTMAQVLAGDVSELELGALLIALRMKGESLDEICGFLQATHEHCMPLHSDTPVVLIPSYNGSRRLCNLTPLLATLLAQEGMRVLVHGPLLDPARVTTATVLQDLGLLCLDTRADQPLPADSPSTTDLVLDAWSRHEPAFVSTACVCPPLQSLLDRRWQLGVRNIGHTLAKMLNPVRGTRSLRLVNFTHPEFGALMQQWAQREGIDAMLLRGTEGEPVADPRRMPRIETFIAGQTCAVASCAAHEGVLSELPLLPRDNDAASTAVYVQSVLSGERPAPAPLLRQVELIRAAVTELQSPAQRLERTA